MSSFSAISYGDTVIFYSKKGKAIFEVLLVALISLLSSFLVIVLLYSFVMS